ncbi:MAG: hypothetical protein Q8Q07_03175 [Dehalococcoidales bacterium]|nr:hypothetical protein [Dehalococcoidales bacterium]
MSRTSTLVLRVREADEADFNQPVIRIHESNRPQNIRWGDRVQISLDRKNWISCQPQPTGEAGAGKIYIGIRLRGILNKDTIGLQIAQLEVPATLYLRKAFSWKTSAYFAVGVLLIISVVLLIFSRFDIF